MWKASALVRKDPHTPSHALVLLSEEGTMPVLVLEAAEGTWLHLACAHTGPA